MCNKPLKAYKNGITETGKNRIVFRQSDIDRSLPVEEVELPCGRCIACRIEKTRIWGMRAEHEAKFHDENCFITLTYAPEHLPPSLEKEPLQKFMKRLRKSLDPIKVKYIASGELGDNYDNPHYHICLFGYMPDDLQFLYERDGNSYFTSPLIEKTWEKGFVVISALNFSTARYTAKYAIKKELGTKEKIRPAEFFVCSQGIGKSHVEKYGYDMASKGSTYANNHTCSLPRYYKEHIKNTSNGVTLLNTLDKVKQIRHNKKHQQQLTEKQIYNQRHNNDVILKSRQKKP